MLIINATVNGHYSPRGSIPEAPGDSWAKVDKALRNGGRGLAPSGGSLARLLEEGRGVTNRLNVPHLSKEKVLAWADAHLRRTGQWPTRQSGLIPESPGDTWSKLDDALRKGARGFRLPSSLVQLLARHRGVRNRAALPKLTERHILQWAEAHRRRTGSWPNRSSGPMTEVPGETWSGVNSALEKGLRGCPKGSSLARLLVERRGATPTRLLAQQRRLRRDTRQAPRLTYRQILAWADAHHVRTGLWPTQNSGPIADATEETWQAVENALLRGGRGLRRAGSSLARLLARYRGVRNRKALPQLNYAQIVRWAKAHRRRTGQWPNSRTGPVPEAGGETWSAISAALRVGCRGLPGGISLERLLHPGPFPV